jgi:co-chaperonin GroES (HSP10)
MVRPRGEGHAAMKEPTIGNAATELGQFEQGANFEGINRSNLIEAPAVLDVEAEKKGNDVHLNPRAMKDFKVGQKPELLYTPLHQTLAELVEVPEFSIGRVGKVKTSPERMMQLSTRSLRESLVWYAITPHQEMAALDLPPDSNGRVIVRMDTLESEYSCQVCKGLGYDEAEVCETCRGEQSRDGLDCESCKVLGYARDTKWSCGHRACTSCRGSGWRSGIIVPEVAQGRPVTGVVVSCGPNTCVVRLGDRVLHSKFAGHALTTPGHETFTVMRESEVIALLEERR